MSLRRLATLVEGLSTTGYLALVLTLGAIGLGLLSKGLTNLVGIIASRNAEENLAWMPYNTHVSEVWVSKGTQMPHGQWVLLRSRTIIEQICKRNGSLLDSLAIPVISVVIRQRRESAGALVGEGRCDGRQIVSAVVDSSFLTESSALVPNGFALLDPRGTVTYSSRRADDMTHIPGAMRLLKASDNRIMHRDHP